MNPYKEGTLGVIEEGGYADIILVDGNPLEDLEAVLRDEVDFVMKDGLVYKNWLPGENAPAFLPADPKHEAYFGNLQNISAAFLLGAGVAFSASSLVDDLRSRAGKGDAKWRQTEAVSPPSTRRFWPVM